MKSHELIHKLYQNQNRKRMIKVPGDNIGWDSVSNGILDKRVIG